MAVAEADFQNAIPVIRREGAERPSQSFRIDRIQSLRNRQTNFTLRIGQVTRAYSDIELG
jgi:hypothetical protein